MKNLLILIAIFFSLIACKKDNNLTEPSTLEIIKNLKTDKVHKNLDTQKGLNKKDFSYDDIIYFNLDLSNPKSQVIHLSSDNEKLPFLILCKVDAQKIENTEEYKINDFKIAVRSIESDPNSIFKISGTPIISEIDNQNYRFQLNAELDFVGSKNKLSKTIIPNVNFKKSDIMDVHIEPLNFIETLIEQFPNKFNKSLENEVKALCCNGVICKVRFTD